MMQVVPTNKKNLHPTGGHTVVVNTKAAREFLDVLFPNTNHYVFATFSDNKLIKGAAKQAFTSELRGTFSSHVDKLTEMNEKGAGVYVTVNNNDGKGRHTNNITGINCVYIEADSNADKIPELLEKVQMEPSIIVESSPGKFHYYFLIEEENIQEFEEARGVLQRLVDDYHGDNNAKDITRVLRIPGFAHLKGPQFEVKLIKAEHIRYKWEDIKHKFPPSERRKIASQQALRANLYQNVPDTLENILKLSYISPECDRDQWLKILMGLHHEYRGSNEGLKIATEWSRGEYEKNKKVPVNFDSDDDTLVRWNSFNFSTGKLSQTTMGTITLIAQNNGYMGKHDLPPEKFEFAKDKLNGKSTDKDAPVVGTTNDVILKKISEQYAIATSAAGGTRIAHRRPSRGNYIYSNEQSVKLALGAVKITVVKGVQKPQLVQESAFNAWLNSDYPMRFKEIGFKPEAKMYCDDDKLSIIRDERNPDFLNEFYGFEIRPKVSASTDHTLDNTVLDLVSDIIADGDKEVTEYLHNWIAHTRQFPHKKTGVMVTLMGDKGTGKSVMSEIITELHEPYTYTTADFGELTGNWNDHLASTTLLALEEATWGGNEKDNSTLKHLITSPTMSIKRRNHDNNAHGQNFFDIIATANPGFSVPEDMRAKERRFFTISVSDKRAKDKKYFSQFGYKGDKKRRNICSLYAEFLDNLDLSNWDPQKIPGSVGKHSRFNQIEAEGSAVKFLISCVEEDRIIMTNNTSEDIDITVSETNRLWNASSGVKGDPSFEDPTNGKCYLKVSALKASFQNYSKHTRSSKLDSAHIVTELESKLPKHSIQKRTRPPAIIHQNYDSIIAGDRLLEIPNRRAIKDYLVSINLMDP